MFYERYLELCKLNNVSPSRAALNIGVSKTSVIRWREGAMPNAKILEKLAGYFSVSTDYLLGNEKTASSVDEAVEQKLSEINDKLLKLNPEKLEEAEKYLDYLISNLGKQK